MFTKEQENEAELLRASPSSSELLPKDHQHRHGVNCDPLDPFWPFLFLPVMIPVMISNLDPSLRPDVSVYPLPPHLTLGLTGPLEDCDPAALHAQGGNPAFPRC